MSASEPPALVIYEHPSGENCAVYVHGDLMLEGKPDGLTKALIDVLGQNGVATVFWEDTYLLGRGVDEPANSLEEIAYHNAGEMGRLLRRQEIDREIRRLQGERHRLEARMET